MSLTDYPNVSVDRERLINDIYALRVDLQLLSDGLARAAEPILHPDVLWAIQTATAILQQGYPVRRH